MHSSDAMSYDDLCPDDDPEPLCAECGAGLYTEEHTYDCSIGDDEANDPE